jgi:prepilin-type processing-associated H-X9-DG protein
MLAEHSGESRYWGRLGLAIVDRHTADAVKGVGFAMGFDSYRNSPQPPSNLAYAHLGNSSGPLFVHPHGTDSDVSVSGTLGNPQLFPEFTPQSEHAGGVNAAFCDGRAVFLSTDIAKEVYVRLVTATGTRFGEQALGDKF